MIKSKKNEEQKNYYDVVKMIDHIIILFFRREKMRSIFDNGGVKNYLGRSTVGMVAAAGMILSVFIPFFKLMGVSVSMWERIGSFDFEGIIMIICGAIGIFAALTEKNLLMSFVSIGGILDFVAYYNSVKKTNREYGELFALFGSDGIKFGIGAYLLFACCLTLFVVGIVRFVHSLPSGVRR